MTKKMLKQLTLCGAVFLWACLAEPEVEPARSDQRITVQTEGRAQTANGWSREWKHGSRRNSALVRKGLCVIVDFADAHLEDWSGPGVNSVPQIADQLREMEEHWEWLSRGRERVQWDIVRVQLPQALSASAFPGWPEFRSEVASAARAQIDPADYDVDEDGVVDSMWIIPTSLGQDYDYSIGGASRNAGANIFVDPQHSQSISERRTGNFNHEFGHTLGLPDLYGPYSTLGPLTVMDASWNLPPGDITAYERSLLGWLNPRPVRHTAYNVHVRPASTQFDAIKLTTSVEQEYFLVEYRRTPAQGFGSVAPPYDGLVVYHVLEGSNQGRDPPLLKVEAADGVIGPGESPNVDDLLYPENARMLEPLVLRSYLSGEEVFRIDNVARTRHGMRFNVAATQPTASANLLPNESFEEGDTSPNGWSTGAYRPEAATFEWTSEAARSGQRGVVLTATEPNDMEWRQHVGDLSPGRNYMLCGFLRAEEVVGYDGSSVGGTIGVSGTFEQANAGFGTYDWRSECLTFAAPDGELDVGCRLGGFGSLVTGTLFCDDMSLWELQSAF